MSLLGPLYAVLTVNANVIFPRGGKACLGGREQPLIPWEIRGCPAAGGKGPVQAVFEVVSTGAKSDPIWNRPIRPFSVLAWPDSSLDTQALFSAAAELAWTTLEISLMPFSTSTIISDCWTLAAAISSIRALMEAMQSLMSCMAETAWSVDSVPVFTS